jgi:hypothetical protein
VKLYCRSHSPCSLCALINSHRLQPLMTCRSIKHICATISESSFISWPLSDRIGSSHAFLALCREPRAWLQLMEAGAERAILQMTGDACHEVLHDLCFCFYVFHFACTGAHKRSSHGHSHRSAWPQPDATHGQTRPQQRMPNVLQLHDRSFCTFSGHSAQ